MDKKVTKVLQTYYSSWFLSLSPVMPANGGEDAAWSMVVFIV